MDKTAIYDSIINGISDYVALVDNQYRYIAMNKSYAEALGIDPESAIGKSPADFFGEDFIAKYTRPWSDQCLLGEKVQYQLWFKFPNQSERYMDVILNPVFDDQGKVGGYIYQGTDITDQYFQIKHTEDLELALTNAMQGVSRLDENGIFVVVRDEYARMLGYTSDELTGQSWKVTVPEEDHEGGFKAFEVMLRDGRAEHESLAVRKDGSIFYKQLLLVQIKNDDGEHVGHYCFMRDISENKKAELKLRENEQRLQEIIKATNVGTWEWNIKDHVVTLSDRWKEISGYDLDELKLVSDNWWWDWIHPDDRDESRRLMDEHFNKESEFYECTCRVFHKTGKTTWVVERGQVVEWAEDGKPLRMSGTLTDITHTKQSEEELKKLSKAVEASSAAVVIMDPVGIIEYVNPGFIRNYGYERKEVIGKPISILQAQELSPSNYADMLKRLDRGQDWKGTLPHVKRSGEIQQNNVIISSIKNHLNEVTHYISIHQDITHEYELSRKLSFQASHDALTGLYNRREFERRAKAIIKSTVAQNTRHALCFLDLDQFKIVNDTCGHIAGDDLLRQISSLLRDQTREGDMLARLGGDEFALLMEHCSMEHAQRVVKKILNALQEYQFSWGGHTFRIGASIGLVAIDEYVSDYTELMKHADASCYAAKELGRNRYHVFNPSDEVLSQRHGEMQWVTEIYNALEKDLFCLYAQRITPISNRETQDHYELLIRMRDEDGKIFLPGSFLPAAERYNLITKIDRWVINHAFNQLKEQPDFLARVQHLSINISGPSLTDETFLDFVRGLLKDSSELANKLCFEITETAAIANLTRAQQTIVELKKMGCAFSLDDFGSGLSSFAYLKNLPVDYIKIDGMFVKDIKDDPIDREMVRSINQIAQVMGMKTIAEFVENDEIKGMLRLIGVDYAQGYGIEKPRPLDELLGNAPNVSDNVVAFKS